MFCQKCGTELPDDSVFCEKCGNKVGSEKVNEKIEDNEVIFELKPVYKFLYKLLPTIIGFVIIFLFTIAPMAIVALVSEDGGGAFLGILIVYILVIVPVITIKYLLNSKQYECYDYDFYKTKVVYKDGFLNRAEKEVKYKYIREVTMRQSFIQRLFGLGTITLYTNAETGYGNGINIIDLENVEEKYREVKRIINV